MAITLAQAKVGMADKVSQTVIDEFRRESFILDRLTFDNAVSPGTGGSTLTYGYVQLQTPSTAGGRAINAEYQPNEAIKVKKTTDLKILGGAFEIDRVLEDTSASSEISFQLDEKIKATRNDFHNLFINGDAATQPLDFDGIDKLVTGSSTDMTIPGGLDVSTLANIKANGADVCFYLNELISKLAEKPDMLLMNSRMYNIMVTIGQNMGYKTESEDAFGRPVTGYNNIPMIDMGQYFNGTASIDVIGIDGTAGTSVIYPVKLGMNALHGVSPTGNKIIKTYLPDMSQPGAVKRGEVEFVCGIALKNTLMAGALRGIKVA